jgi:hypothetical protein
LIGDLELSQTPRRVLAQLRRVAPVRALQHRGAQTALAKLLHLIPYSRDTGQSGFGLDELVAALDSSES